MLDCREPVGDDDRGAAPQHVGHRPLDQPFRLRVHAARRLVEDEHDLRVVRDRAGKCDQLFLSHGEAGAAFLHLGPIAVRETIDEPSGSDVPGRLPDLFLGDLAVAQPDVALDRPREEEDILEHEADVAAEVLLADLADVHAVDQHLSPLRVVESHQQVDDGRLPGARVTDYRHPLPGFDGERDPPEHPSLVFLIGEPHVAELDPALHPWQHHRDGGILKGDGFVNEPEDPLGGGHRGLEDVELV